MEREYFQNELTKSSRHIHTIVVQLSRHKFNLFIMNRYM